MITLCSNSVEIDHVGINCIEVEILSYLYKKSAIILSEEELGNRSNGKVQSKTRQYNAMYPIPGSLEHGDNVPY